MLVTEGLGQYINIHAQTHIHFEGAHGVMVIVVANGHRDPSSNLE